MTRVPQGALAGLLAAALIAPAAHAHPEPGGQLLVVCKRDSAKRIRRIFSGARERRRLRLVDKCRFRHVQQGRGRREQRRAHQAPAGGWVPVP